MFIIFFVIFHNDKPVDWLLEHLIQTKLCRFDKDLKDCRKQKDLVWLHHKPSLFQHIGTHSSLKGKVQKLRDRGFGKLSLFYPHKDNPMAEVSTTLKEYKGHSIERCYFGETFFWGMTPKKGDNITINFVPPIHLERYVIWGLLHLLIGNNSIYLNFLICLSIDSIDYCFLFHLRQVFERNWMKILELWFSLMLSYVLTIWLLLLNRYFIRTSNSEHPEDRLIDARVDVLPVNKISRIPNHLEVTTDGYFVIGGFKIMKGMANGFVPHLLSPVKQLRITMTEDSDRWVIINEVFVHFFIQTYS